MGMKKGSMGMPVEFLVFFVIAIVLFGIAFVFLNPLHDIGEEEAAKSALTSCCTNYLISGFCGDEIDDFTCKVPSVVDAAGEMEISALAREVGVDYVDYCCS